MNIQNPNNKTLNFKKLGFNPYTNEEWEEQKLLHDNDFF
jgi:hypothetical protein